MQPLFREGTSVKPNDSARILAGFQHLPGHLDRPAQEALMLAVADAVAVAPLYRPSMPHSGKPFTVRMTNCGALGWVSDKSGGYRYQAVHPRTGLQWPPIPAQLMALWDAITAYPARPEACLINHYAPGARLGSHVDSDEVDRAAPVVSVSLGCDAIFHVGGLKRSDPKAKLLLKSGDVVVLGGHARMAYHGLDRIIPATSDLVAWGGRINLTLRRVTG